MEVLWFFRMPRGADAPPLSERSLKMPARRCTTGPSGAITLPQFLENKDVMWTDVKWSWLVSFRICFHDFYMVCIVYICVYTLHTYIHTYIHTCFVMWNVRQLYYTLPNCSCPDPFVTPDGYEKNGTVWQCARGYAGNPELLCQEPVHIIHIISPLDSGRACWGHLENH